jgi:predicted Rossmann fold nucleotide-binding protein DprA/Smf involved in DNA uptake
MDRLRLAHEAWELARERLIAFVGSRNPQWSKEEVVKEVAKRLAHESG